MSLLANKKYFLLDTCIAEYWLDAHMHDAITSQITAWTGNTFDLAISEISYAEMIDGAYKQKIDRVKQLLTSYTQIEVSQRVLIGSAFISNVYKAKLKKTNGAGLQDKIIAATAFIYNLPIITADVLDYPHPFFTSISSETLAYSKKSTAHKQYITIDLLKPNTTELNYWYTQVK